MEYSNGIKKLPPYVFVDLDRKKKAAIAAGRDIINLGIGDPDKPTPKSIIRYFKKCVDKPENHQYPIGRGTTTFRQSVVDWMKKRFNVVITPAEVECLIGAKDGITHLPLAFLNPGDIVLVPDPGYPGYTSGTYLAGGETYVMPLEAKNKFLPDLEAIPEEIYNKVKIMWLNYPNNPTSAMADRKFYEKVISYAKKYDFIAAQDAPYSEIYFGKPPMSILEIEGAKEHVVEFYSMSKTFNMTGWRIGFAVGGEKIINGLAAVKENMDSGTFTAIQDVAGWALLNCDREAAKIRRLYKRRAGVFTKGLRKLGYEVLKSQGTLYLWVRVPGSMKSMDFCSMVLDKGDMVVTPGIGFGKYADGYFRIALTVDEPLIHKALDRFAKLKI
ncbi:MAG: LL-diaminopimelate aminotransferase [Spirochaetia bacterium]|nr:LL-diaminopimelate aminotransferase [Spirochaetia bacterium]